jgi:hypothetical protein
MLTVDTLSKRRLAECLVKYFVKSCIAEDKRDIFDRYVLDPVHLNDKLIDECVTSGA